MDFPNQPRTFLLLDDNPSADVAREILESPLGLAQDVVCMLFNDNFVQLQENLDIIKEFVAGVTRAKSLGNYSIANYYSLMFAFHQHFHSSYRARQGKALESVLRKALNEQTDFTDTPKSVKKEMIPLLKKAFNTTKIPNNDIDVLGSTKDKKRIIVIQLRSRDDTGGTTAKGSLVDMLRSLLRTSKRPKADILYLVGIWDERYSQQRESTIKKIYSSISEYTKLSENDLKKIGSGVFVAPKIKLQMAYGVDELLDCIFKWDMGKKKHNISAVKDIINKIERWDDLWLSYAIASIEIENQSLRGVSNIRLLWQKCHDLDVDLDYRSYQALEKSIEIAVPKLIASWTEDTLPVRSPAEQSLYIRDLLYLKAIHETKCKSQNYEQRPKTKLIHESALYYQTGLFKVELPPQNAEPELVSFRELMPEISDTSYLTHGIFYYPAKFIPQIPRFCIEEYTQKNGWVIDPFAGSGTVGLEALLCGRNAVLLDINPLLETIVPLKILFRDTTVEKKELTRLLDDMRKSGRIFNPEWSNLEYWYDADILDVLKKYWGWLKLQEKSSYHSIIQASLLKASKHFSYAEHKAPKLFKSKTKRAEMEILLQKNWKEELDNLIYETSFDILTRVKQLSAGLLHNQSQTLFYGGVDSAKFIPTLDFQTDAVITSPPYLQAQEYIRTSKLELYWLGCAEEQIKQIGKNEIPYRKADNVVSTPTLDVIRASLVRDDLRAMLDSYFCYTIQALENSARTLKDDGRLCVFVGNPKVDGIEVETWRIISEYFSNNGFLFSHVYEDRIKNRQLFRGRKNKNPDGMKSEFLLVMNKQ